MVNTAAMEQMTKYYWGMLGARAAAAGATTAAASLSRHWPPPAHAAEPSWEELAFARDAAGHLGGCVWPPRSYSCTFCRREFRSAQALGGHMNVHRRDRARLRHASPDRDAAVQHDAHQQHAIAPPPDQHHQQLRQLQEAASPLFMRASKAAVLLSGPKSTCQAYDNMEGAVISTTSPSYISTIIKESKNSKLVISIPATTAGTKHVLDHSDEEETMAENGKRRRLDQPPEAVLPFFLRLPASSERVCQQDAKVPQVITSPSFSSHNLGGLQEVDLELRLGTSPKVV